MKKVLKIIFILFTTLFLKIILFSSTIYAADAEWLKSFKTGMTLQELGVVVDKKNQENGWAWDNIYTVTIKAFIDKSFGILNTGQKTSDISVNVCKNNDKVFMIMYFIRSGKESLEISKAYEYIVAELLVNATFHETRRATDYAKNKEDYTRGGGLSFYVGKELIEIGIFNLQGEMVMQILRNNEDVCKS